MFKLEDVKPSMFEFEYKGMKYEVPTIDSLPFDTWMRIRKRMNNSENMTEVGFDEVMGLFEQYIPDVMAEITLEQAKELFIAYVGSASVNLGE